MSQPGFAPVIYRTIPAGAATFGVVSELDPILHELWDGMQWVGITSITPTVAPVAVNQYVSNVGTVFMGTADHKVLSRESKTAIAIGTAVDVAFLPAEVIPDPTKVSYVKSTAVLTGSYAYGTMTAYDILVNSVPKVYWTGGFIVEDIG